MKKLKILAGLMMAAMLFASCSKEQQDANPAQKDVNFKTTPELLAGQYPLYAGQNIFVGYVEILLNENTGKLNVCYVITEAGWVMTQYHFAIGTDVTAIPRTKGGEPIPGQFPYKGGIDYETTFCFDVPAPEGLFECNAPFFAAAHVVVGKWTDDVFATQTAWGGTEEFVPGGMWATKIEDAITCTDDLECWHGETAWADGEPYNDEGGSWAMYTAYPPSEVVDLIAGQNMNAGFVSFSEVANGKITITITLSEDWRFAAVPKNVKIQDYDVPPSGNPKIGNFEWYDMADESPFTIEVDANYYYGIHVDVEQRVDCPPPPAE